MKAITAMTVNVVCIAPRETLRGAYEIMTEWGIRHLPVMEGKKLVGILSDRDILIRSSLENGVIHVPESAVSGAMTPQPMTCGPSTSVAHMVDLMLEHKIDSLPILDEDGILVGLVTSADLLEMLREREQLSGHRAIPFKFQIQQGAARATGFAST